MNMHSLYQGSWTLYLIIIWSLVWKGLALWRSARRGQRYWFLIILVINTFGILEILYLFYFSTKGWENITRKFSNYKKKKGLKKEKSEGEENE